jgi:hypothetical protein
MVIFTKHARQRMRERHITRQTVFQILRNPDRVETSKNGSNNYIGSAGRKKVKIVAGKQGKRTIIITLYHI